MANRKKSYVPAPEVPPELRQRFAVIVEVISGEKTVRAGARECGMSRNHFQTLMHRALGGLIEGLQPKPAGRPPTPPAERELRGTVDQLRQQNERLQRRVDTVDRLLAVASDLVKGRVQAASGRPQRSRRSRSVTPTEEDPAGDDPKVLLQGAQALRELGLPMRLIASVIGVSLPTLRRWRARRRRGLRLRWAPGPVPLPGLDDAAAIEGLVRQTGGMVGAEAIHRTLRTVSRRQAAHVKAQTLTAMERERQSRCERLYVAAPGFLRGFDAMHVLARRGQRRYLLASADAAIPYRTSLEVVERYDAASVARAVEADFRRHGAPLVWRVDRARAHDAPEVQEVLRSHGVLLLHGPARYARFYGQLERQNRDHRRWLDLKGPFDAAELPEQVERMRTSLNDLWRRPTLGWRSASEIWKERPDVTVNRAALAADVDEHRSRLRWELDGHRDAEQRAQRLAIERALSNRGILLRQDGGWC